MFGRFGGLRSTLGQPDYFYNVAMPGVGALGKLHLNNYAGVLASTTTLSPTKVLDVRYGFARFHWDRLSRSYGFDQTTLGFPASLVAQQQVPVFPAINTTGYSGLAGSNFLLIRLDTHALVISLSQLSGRHNLKYGVELHLQRLSNFALGQWRWSICIRQHHDTRTQPERLNGQRYRQYATGYADQWKHQFRLGLFITKFLLRGLRSG